MGPDPPPPGRISQDIKTSPVPHCNMGMGRTSLPSTKRFYSGGKVSFSNVLMVFFFLQTMHSVWILSGAVVFLLITVFIFLNETFVETINTILYLYVLDLQRWAAYIWEGIPSNIQGFIYQNLVKNVFVLFWNWSAWLCGLLTWPFCCILLRICNKFRGTQLPNNAAQGQRMEQLENDITQLKEDNANLTRKVEQLPNNAVQGQRMQQLENGVTQLKEDNANLTRKVELLEQVQDSELENSKREINDLRDILAEKNSELENSKEEINDLHDIVQEKDRELESVKKSLKEKDGELDSVKDALKLRMTKEPIQLHEQTETKHADGQMNKSEIKDQFVGPKSQIQHELKATHLSPKSDIEKTKYLLPTTSCEDIRVTTLGSSSSKNGELDHATCSSPKPETEKRTTSSDGIRASTPDSNSSSGKGPDPSISVNNVCEVLNDLLTVLIEMKKSGKEFINEDDYKLSEVEDMVIKSIDMKNAFHYKHSVEIPRKGCFHHPTEEP